MKTSPNVGSAGLSLVPATPGRPVQAVGDGVFATITEVEKPADFSKGERDQASMDG